MRLTYEPSKGGNAVGHLGVWPFERGTGGLLALVMAEGDTLYVGGDGWFDDAGRSAYEVRYAPNDAERASAHDHAGGTEFASRKATMGQH